MEIKIREMRSDKNCVFNIAISGYDYLNSGICESDRKYFIFCWALTPEEFCSEFFTINNFPPILSVNY